MAVPVVPVFGPATVHPDGAFDTTQLSIWFGGVPVSEKLSQLLSLRVMDPARAGEAVRAKTSVQKPNDALSLEMRDRIMCTPRKAMERPPKQQVPRHVKSNCPALYLKCMLPGNAPLCPPIGRTHTIAK
jgi:hypothetical protein